MKRSSLLAANIDAARTVVLVDVHNLAWRAAHVYSAFGRPEKRPHVYGFGRMVLSVLKYARPPVLLVFAEDRRPVRRRRLFKEYKANRPKVTARAVVDPIPDVYEFIRSVPSWIVYAEDHEADDVIGAFYYQKVRRRRQTLIASNDRDLYQLLDHTNVLIASGKHLIDREKALEEEFHGLAKAALIPNYKAILGDASDNIAPIRPRLRKRDVVTLLNRYQMNARLIPALRREWHFSDWELRQYALRYRELFRLKVTAPLQIERVKLWGSVAQQAGFTQEEVSNALGREAERLERALIKNFSVWS